VAEEARKGEVTTSRTLVWDGCCNIRDLGGLPTEDGAETRFRVVVRADDVGLLSPAGWDALLDYGVRKIVDLRHEDPPYESPLEVVRVPLLDAPIIREVDELLVDVDDPVAWRCRHYLFFLERLPQSFARAVTAVAEGTNETVLVHCAGGVDRTGLVTALLLRVAGVGVEAIAADYAESEASWAPSAAKWVEAAPDDVQRRKRRLLSVMPAVAMRDVLVTLEQRHGSVQNYLVQGGADAESLRRAAERLRG
jgi:protein-tyrosine phosphatase